MAVRTWFRRRGLAPSDGTLTRPGSGTPSRLARSMAPPPMPPTSQYHIRFSAFHLDTHMCVAVLVMRWIRTAELQFSALGEDKTHKGGIRPDLLLSASTTPPVAP